MSDIRPPFEPRPGPDQAPLPDPRSGGSVPASVSPEHAEPVPGPPPWDPADRSADAEPRRVDDWGPAGPDSGRMVDPSVVIGPPWPRLVAAGEYTPPRLIRWPIVVGIVLFVGTTILRVVASSGTSSTTASGSPYVLMASDARFSATFPAKAQRSQQSLGAAANQLTEITYDAQLPDEEVAVAYFSLPESTPFDLDGAITGEAENMSGQVVSRSRAHLPGPTCRRRRHHHRGRHRSFEGRPVRHVGVHPHRSQRFLRHPRARLRGPTPNVLALVTQAVPTSANSGATRPAVFLLVEILRLASASIMYQPRSTS